MFETREIERHLIKLITNNKLLARPYIHKLDPELFSGIRQNIVHIIISLFEVSPTIITETLFDTELHKLFPNNSQASEIQRHITEWNLIQNSNATESIDILFEKLQERKQSEKVAKLCEKTLEFLQLGNINDAVNVLKTESIKLDSNDKNNKPVINLLEYQDVLDRINDQKLNPDKYKGLQTGFPTIDKRLGGLFNSEMILFSAVTGIGKSTILKQIAKGIITNNYCKNVLHITNEEHREQVRMKYFSLLSDVDYFKFKQAIIDDAEIEKFKNSIKNISSNQYGRIFIKELPQFSNVTEIYKEIHMLEQQGFPIHAIVLDYLDHLSPVQRAWSENDEQAKSAWDCKGLCVDFNIPLITATQAATEVEAKQEKGRQMGKLDVYGSKRRIHASNIFIGITYNGNYDETQLIENGGKRETSDDCDKFWTAKCLKSRDGSTFKFECRHRVFSGEVLEERWSDNLCINKIISATNEIMQEMKKEESNSNVAETIKPIEKIFTETESEPEEIVLKKTLDRQKIFESNTEQSRPIQKSAMSIIARLKQQKNKS